MNVKFEELPKADFQIVLLDRDRFGVPTGKKVYFSSDRASDISDFYDAHEQKMSAIQRRSKNKSNNKNNKNNNKNNRNKK